MPRSDLSRLSRLSSILTHLQSKQLITAAQLAEKFGISIRTIYRDIRALEQAGIPIYTEQGKGYSLVEGFNLPPVMFTREEANALITAEKQISRNKDGSFVKHYSDAITKIRSILKYRDKGKVELLSERIAFLNNFSNDTTSNYLSTLQIGIIDYNVIMITYQALYREGLTTRHIEPLALYHTRENWILIAWCRLRNSHREFRLDRIKKMLVSAEKFEPRAFDLLTYFRGIVERK